MANQCTKFEVSSFSCSEYILGGSKQEALVWQRDCASRLSVEILQLQKIPFENWSPGPIMWHYLHDPTFSHFHTIPECDGRHTRLKACDSAIDLVYAIEINPESV